MWTDVDEAWFFVWGPCYCSSYSLVDEVGNVGPNVCSHTPVITKLQENDQHLHSPESNIIAVPTMSMSHFHLENMNRLCYYSHDPDHSNCLLVLFNGSCTRYKNKAFSLSTVVVLLSSSLIATCLPTRLLPALDSVATTSDDSSVTERHRPNVPRCNDMFSRNCCSAAGC